MPYPEAMVAPMREELTRLGVEELRDAEAVDEAFSDAEGTTVAVINSVCGCAAANARPAVALVRQGEVQPDRYVTVFAGQDTEATDQLREAYLPGIPPSSPFIALFQGKDPVYLIERRHIEGRSASAIAADLQGALEKHVNSDAQAEGAPERPATETGPQAQPDNVPSTFRSIK